MYTIDNSICEQSFDKLQIVKLNAAPVEILSISLGKGTIFPEHTSPRDVTLTVLEGEILFNINDATHHLKKHQIFKFPKKVPHWVEALENSKFLIIR